MKDLYSYQSLLCVHCVFFYCSCIAFSRPLKLYFFSIYLQFEEQILDITLKILDSSIDYRRDSRKDVNLRHEPVHVGRVLSAMVRSPSS